MASFDDFHAIRNITYSDASSAAEEIDIGVMNAVLVIEQAYQAAQENHTVQGNGDYAADTVLALLKASLALLGRLGPHIDRLQAHREDAVSTEPAAAQSAQFDATWPVAGNHG